MKNLITVLTLSLLAVVRLTGPVAAEARNVFADAVRAVAEVELEDGNCTAFSPVATLWVTQLHCANSDYKFLIRGELAEFVREDKNLDLLLLRGVVGPTIKIAEEEPALGDSLAMFGWPRDWSDAVPFISYGRVSALNILRYSKAARHKQTRVNAVNGSVYFGMSGGPAINSNGEAVGVIHALSVAPPIPIAYITPLKALRKFLGMEKTK